LPDSRSPDSTSPDSTSPDTASPDTASPARPSVAIIGGGVIGLSLGWRLARAGCSVDLFERGTCGREASHAAAGMLAAGIELEPGEEGLLPLTLESQRLWPAFAAELEAESGQPVDLRAEGTIATALTRDDVDLLRQKFEHQRRQGLDLHWLTGAAVKEREPWLNPRTAAGVFSPADHQVDNRRLTAACRMAFERAGGRVHEQADVTAVDVVAGRCRGVVVGDRPVAADITVLAAGAWSRGIAGLPPGAVPPVRPVKGQMASLRMPAGEPLLRHVLWPPKAYLVPRRDGTLIIGATTEEKGFDRSLTAGGVLALLEAAWRALPAIEECPVIEFWTGFRPGSRDDAPILGPVTGTDGLVLATGHHRNGILLTPVTALALADFILSGRLPDSLAPFTQDRFTRDREAA